MYITKDKLADLLTSMGIEPREDDANIEFEIIDQDYRGHIRFKDFVKFVKKNAKGKAYESVDHKYQDSSISSDSEEEQSARKEWKREIDPERSCAVPYDNIA